MIYVIYACLMLFYEFIYHIHGKKKQNDLYTVEKSHKFLAFRFH